MNKPDLNLLFALEALVTETSVARAARRLRLSPSAMSRALARLREMTGDPLLVRAGRGLVPTPRALELRESVSRIVQEAQAALAPVETLNLQQLARTFTLRVSDGFAENFGPMLLTRIGEAAPGVRLRFIPKADRDSAPLRDGGVDLDTGVVGSETSPELRTQALFRDRFIGVVRSGHPLGGGAAATAGYAGGRHIVVSRRGLHNGGPVDEALARAGLERQVAAMVGGFATALALARASDLIATVPERHTESLRAGMDSFPLPVPSPEIMVSMMWHPRMDADAAHRWLRNVVRDVCATLEIRRASR